MSFLIDPPLLFLSGILIYLVGGRLEWSRHAKIVAGAAIALSFIAFSLLLYADMIRCVFPGFTGLKGSEFMFHTDITGIDKAAVPPIIVAFLFLLYPVWIFCGYASLLLNSKRKRRSRDVHSYKDVKSRIKRGPSSYAVARDPDAGKCLRDAVNALGGIEKFVKKGDRVLIKVNICGGNPETPGTFTGTAAAEALVDLVIGAGGRPFFADADMIWTKFWQAAADSGWMKWARDKGMELVNLSETRIVLFDFGRESALGKERVSAELIEADVVISLAVMKTHLLTGVTLAMKNMYGTLPEVDKAKYHRKKIEDVIYELNLAFKPNLAIIDGSIGGDAVGPLSCTPLNFQTIVVSDDVVAADAVACQLMGYHPFDIAHIKIAHERGLGDASQKFDPRNLPYSHVKDGNWDRPEPKVKDFYEWSLESLLRLPGWDTLFNIGADFFLYDLSRLPVFRYFTPSVLRLLSDLVSKNLSAEETEESLHRKRTNTYIAGMVATLSLLGFYLQGFFARSSLLFDISYLLAIALSILAARRMKTGHLLALIGSSALMALIVEGTLTYTGMVTYFIANPYFFAVPAWVILMIAFLEVIDRLRTWLRGLGIFSKLSGYGNLPIVLTVLALATFLTWEGYLEVAWPSALLMYTTMAALGLLYSRGHSMEWNAAIMVVGIGAGGYMELLGNMSGFWHYHFSESLPIFILFAWALNTWAAQGLAALLGFDPGNSMAEDGK